MPDPDTDDRPPPNTRRRVLLGCLGIPLLLIFFSLLGAWLWYQGEMSKARRDLAVEIQFLRERGAPLTGVELDAFYRLEPQREDITAKLLKVLALADDPQMRALAVSLPIVWQAPDPPPPGEEWAELEKVEAFLAKHQALFDLLATLPERRVTVRFPIDFTLGVHTQLQHVQQVRHAGRLLQLHWHVDLHRGRPNEAAKRILELLQLADTLKNEPLIVSQLVRCALHGMAVQMIEKSLQQTDLSDEDLAPLQLALREYDGQQAWRQGLAGERAFSYSASSLPISMLNAQLTQNQMEEFAGRPPVRPHDAALTLRLFRKMEVATDESLAAAIAASAEVDTEIKQIAGQPVQRIIHMQTMLLMPAVGSAVHAAAGTDATLQAADAGLAAVRFRRANRVWPQQLAQLVPEYLPAVPTDPYDGKPLRFVATENEFKAYSISKDLLDQGGDLTEPHRHDRGFAAVWRENE